MAEQLNPRVSLPLDELPRTRRRMGAALDRIDRRLRALEIAGLEAEPGGLDRGTLRLMRETVVELLAELDQQLAPTDLARRRN